ncbi:MULTISPECIES: ERCC4 domain-containing protein [unclassified Holdemanella]|jgi:ERCC4-type nuclease|uniref:ERCC4 domain-containing protein n=1 Tax=unclassified Holdemanella TaxID=2633909 RepID=UPI001D0B9A80|nr:MULTISPECIES: ERCC4 domain-containing protein [unclassified Holdemanella]MCB8640047.1 hypothetical protein [Holdemanella sp. DFI.5.55]MCG5648810.1 hypothetical protein [Holdemanella sp. DFI.5.21]
MLDCYKYTDKEKQEIINSMVVLVDTREKNNQTLLDIWNKKGLKYKKKKLDYGDYSVMIPKNDKLNIPRDIYFDQKIVVERKGSLSEISGNLTNGRDRLEKELALSPVHKVMLIENGSFEDIANGNYDTQYNKKSFLASLFTFQFRYDMPIVYVSEQKYTALYIRMYFEYYLKTLILR